ncbi:hypothetical protein V1227_03595 [Lentzea sp. DG1S-22]|uniref:hypothetical protein n=1 Tax=Lentzea sp. DG1S-22 TaxID=3108822 RepID=UPI002E7A0823|nr:hypothetical protein [Lentzea sp. DG1S-22]WVH81849.1 hypothetical protein V1227_03595 [Lentzea sp. DG1S-22]
MTVDQVVDRASVPAASRETLEDYTLRFAPRTYRRWTPAVVGASALGGIAYMADFSIGAGIGLTHGRLVFVLVNLAIALVLMEADMFSFLNNLLSFYSNCAMAWVVTVAADIAINKYVLKLSPRQPEFRRGMLHAVNPVGVGSFLASSVLSISVYFGLFGAAVQLCSPLVAVGIPVVLAPLPAVLTRGRFYLRRTDDGIAEPVLDADGNPSGTRYECVVCRESYERPDMAASAEGGEICSLCLSTDRDGRHVLPAP